MENRGGGGGGGGGDDDGRDDGLAHPLCCLPSRWFCLRWSLSDDCAMAPQVCSPACPPQAQTRDGVTFEATGSRAGDRRPRFQGRRRGQGRKP